MMETKDKSRIRGFIFDMDGTLFDTEKLYRAFWYVVAEQRGFHVDDEMLSRMRGMALPKGALIFETRNPEFSYYEERRRRMELVYEEVDRNGVPEKPGLRKLLAFLRAQGYRTAVASSSPEAQVQRYMERNGLTEQFDVLLGGDAVENGKPAPDLFLLAAEKLGLPPAECVVVEDSENGIRAGAAAGGFVIGIPDLDPLDPVRDLLDFECSRLDEIIPWISDAEKRC